MKLLGNFVAIAAIAGLAVACNDAPEATVESKEAKEVDASKTHTHAKYAVNTEGDEIHWVGFKTYTDAEHNGEIQVQEGYFQVDDEQITGGEFVIDMNSITNNDVPEEGDYNRAKLVGHLKSPDFFSVEEYPTAKFTITDIEAAEAGSADGATHVIGGNLEMRGNTRHITIPAIIEMTDGTISMKTPEFVIDRTEWEVQALSTSISGLAKENLVDNNIKLTIDLKADRS